MELCKRISSHLLATVYSPVPLALTQIMGGPWSVSVARMASAYSTTL